MIFVFLGSPGAGKGTQADRAVKTLGFRKVSTGDILRSNIRSRTELGVRVEDTMNRGGFVDDETIMAMVHAELTALREMPPVILDGVPRTIAQCEMLDRFAGPRIRSVIHFEVSTDAIVQRLSGRLICSACGLTYHRDFSPPKVLGACDGCNASLLQRKDDEPSNILTRLRIYAEQTEPVLEYYKKQGKCLYIDGAQPAEAVSGILISHLEACLSVGK